jgi:predicted Zn finger-like uncharacterized protein
VIVRCERCETRFKLDESRLPARGARVRCSRCKHAFFVTPPGAAKEEAVHEVAAEAAQAPAAKPPAPEPSWDLEEGPDATIARRRPAAAASREPEEDNTNADWRFEDDVPGLDPGATRASFDLSGSQTSPSLAAPPDPDESSFAELGDPETWDLLAGDAPPAGGADPEIGEPGSDLAAPDPAAPDPEPEPLAPEAAVAATEPEPRAVTAPAPAPAPPAVEARARPRSAQPAARTAFAPPAVVMPRRIPPAPRSAPALEWGAWAGQLVLVAVIAWGSFRVPATAGGAATFAPVSGFEVGEAHARIVENAAAGPILVVSGRLRNPGPSARALGAPLAVQLLDADGAPLAAAPQPAGPALSEASVREGDPDALVAAQQAAARSLAAAPVAAGAELGFAAVFAPAPRAAGRFVLTTTGEDSGR